MDSHKNESPYSIVPKVAETMPNVVLSRARVSQGGGWGWRGYSAVTAVSFNSLVHGNNGQNIAVSWGRSAAARAQKVEGVTHQRSNAAAQGMPLPQTKSLRPRAQAPPLHLLPPSGPFRGVAASSQPPRSCRVRARLHPPMPHQPIPRPPEPRRKADPSALIDH